MLHRRTEQAKTSETGLEEIMELTDQTSELDQSRHSNSLSSHRKRRKQRVMRESKYILSMEIEWHFYSSSYSKAAYVSEVQRIWVDWLICWEFVYQREIHKRTNEGIKGSLRFSFALHSPFPAGAFSWMFWQVCLLFLSRSTALGPEFC